jgi:hypothetical protein
MYIMEPVKKPALLLVLSEDEALEMRLHPFTFKPERRFTARELKRRFSVAQKMLAANFKTWDGQRKIIEALSNTCPMHKFYRFEGFPARIHSAYFNYDTNKLVFGFILVGTDKIPYAADADKFENVEDWTDADICRIMACDQSGYFLDPLGAIYIARNHATMKAIADGDLLIPDID